MQASLAVLLSTGLIDRLPLLMLFTCITAQSAHLLVVQRNSNWPFPARRPTTRASSSSAVPSWLLPSAAFLLSLLAHFAALGALRANRRAWHAWRRPFHASQRLPGGRLDWDALDPDKHVRPRTPELHAQQVMTLMVLGVWLTPAMALLALCAGQMGLPTAASSGSGSSSGQGRAQVGGRSRAR